MTPGSTVSSGSSTDVFLVHSSAAGHLRGSSVLNDHGVPSYPHVISAAQARALGLSHHAVRHRLQRGLWQPMMRGIYVTHAGPVTADDWDRAALLFARTPSAVISGAAGLRRHGFAGPHPGARLLVLVPSACSRQSSGRITVRHAQRMPRAIMTYPRIPVAVVARCVVDACAGSADLRAVRHTVASAIQRGRCFPQDIDEQLQQVARRGTATIRQAIDEVRAGAASVAEAETATLMRNGGISGFRQNVDVHGRSGEWLACADFYWEELAAVLEIDSREWHFDPAAWQATLERHNRLEAAGFTVMHCTPGQIRRNPEQFVQQVRRWLGARATSLPA